MSEYKDADTSQQNIKEVRESNQDVNDKESEDTLENRGPTKKHLNVLNDDGSFADLPDRDIKGAGAQSAAITE